MQEAIRRAFDRLNVISDWDARGVDFRYLPRRDGGLNKEPDIVRVKVLALAAGLIVSSPANAIDDEALLQAINSPNVEYGAIKTPYGIYLTRAQGVWGRTTASRIIHVDPDTKESTRVEFSLDGVEDSDPAFDERSGRLCFVSTRATETGADPNPNGDIWCAARQDGRWVQPVRLPEPVNSPAREFSPSFTDDGDLFFASDRQGGFGQGDIYRAERKGNGAWSVEHFGGAINSPYGEWNVGIRPDGNAMIVEASSRPTNRTIPGDLYYSEMVAGDWSPLLPLSTVNTDGSDLMARWISDTEILYASAAGADVDHKIARLSRTLPTAPAVVAVSRSSGEIVFLDPETLTETSRRKVGAGPHEIVLSEDGRVAVVPSLGIFPKPHEAPTMKRPPFVTKPSEGLSILRLAHPLDAPDDEFHKAITLSDCARPHGAAADAQLRRVWVTCETEGTVIEFDPGQGAVIRTFNVGAGVHKVEYHAGRKLLFATNPETGEFARIDLKSGAVERLKTGDGAEGFAIERAADFAYVANGFARTICKVEIGEMATEWCAPVNGAFPIAVLLREEEGEIWVSRFGAGDVGVFSMQSGEVIGRVDLPTGALDLAYDGRKDVVFASLPRHNAIIAIDAAARATIMTFDRVMEADDVDLVPAAAFSRP